MIYDLFSTPLVHIPDRCLSFPFTVHLFWEGIVQNLPDIYYKKKT